MTGLEVREVSPSAIDDLNKMCAPSDIGADETRRLMRESADAHERAAGMGARVFGAFLDGEPVGRVEVMPIEAAPVPLEGDELWVIRCLWVLERAKGRGIARSLMELALEASEGARGIAVLTYPDWMPASFFERFGFSAVGRGESGTVMLRASARSAKVALVQAPRRIDESAGGVKVEAVFNSRCPWLVRYYRTRLALARSISDNVTTTEHIIHTREDALRLGEENLYVDGVAPFKGPVGFGELERVVRERLAGKGLQ